MGEQNRRTTEGGPDAAADLDHRHTDGLSDVAHEHATHGDAQDAEPLDPPRPEDAPEVLIHDEAQTRRQAPDEASEGT